ncbi:MAG: hypothetical protein HN793_06600 [Rhodospirillaceae bacterium]|nr:hypothetical protein [Rhodospirillaceae bacterium]MBT5239007.1 hypothetical protein [Rhodospirillaceae bacterium]MBT5565324.1 hypothetical protein [Rhodospirillaceae bacterium]MBT6089151.1 hypothetical protein [Rhodospirillaceae bacterium]MBT7450478.1 hypothetical protein [Rhodospirillaceae bacterium]
MTGKLDSVSRGVKAFAIRRSRHVGALAICAVLGFTVSIVNSRSVTEQIQSGDSWILPIYKELDLVSDVDTILAEPFFGGLPVIIEPPAPVIGDGPILEDWRLIGIITEGERRIIVIMNESSDRIENAQIGDTLPGGELLVEILENAIEIQSDNENMRIALFRDIER